MASYGLSAGLGGGAFLTHSRAALLAVFLDVQRSTTQRCAWDFASFTAPECAQAACAQLASSLTQECLQRSATGLRGVAMSTNQNKFRTKPADLFVGAELI